MNPSMDDAAKGKGCLPWTPQELEELVPDPQQRQRLLGWEEYAKIYKEWRSPVLSELMPHLPRDEQLRLQNRFREEDRIRRRMDKKSPSSSTSSCSSNLLSEQEHDSWTLPFVLFALRHYNARHPGGEFDPVKPLSESSVHFRGRKWFHINFWACSRTNTKMIKRFFAEMHSKLYPNPSVCWDPQSLIDILPIVVSCTIIEPLCQYKRSCGFCRANFDIFHPKGCRKFVCGNDNDRFGQRLEQPRGCCCAIR